jgi:hypothetical protein
MAADFIRGVRELANDLDASEKKCQVTCKCNVCHDPNCNTPNQQH